VENWLRSGSLKIKERDDTLHLGSANSAEVACESDISVVLVPFENMTSYLEFGFTSCGNESEPKPRCVVLRSAFKRVY
jgi:hypothetical protein